MFGLGVQVNVLENEICEIDPEDEGVSNCLLPGEGGQLDPEDFSVTDSTDRQGNTGLSATRPICRFSRP